MLIGLCGFARSGKNSTANILTEIAGFEQHAFADALREMALALDPMMQDGIADIGAAPWEHATFRRYSEMIERYGYEMAKQAPDVRRFLQRLGTEAVRKTFGEDAWVDALDHKLTSVLAIKHIVLTDVRFENEAFYVQRNRRGVLGQLWRITRPGTGPANDHPSEMNQVAFTVDREIVASNLDELREAVTAAWQEVSAV
jgi:hypothetical protein